MSKKTENPLSLWKFSYKASYYIIHPWKWFYDAYWNIRNFIHRGKYGYSYTDVWSWYYWWPIVGAEALKYMKKNHSTYPGTDRWKTPEEWEEYLLRISKGLQFCADSVDNTSKIHKNSNEYSEQFCQIMKTCWKEEREEGSKWISHKLDTTPEQDEIIKKYWDREKELLDEDDIQRIELFTEIAKNLGRFWD